MVGRSLKEVVKPLVIPDSPLRRIPEGNVRLRGTSVRFSKEGSFYDHFGTTPEMLHNRSIHVYVAQPVGETHESWARQLNATFHAAAERALDHSHIAHYLYPDMRGKVGLPVVLFAYSSLTPHLGLASRGTFVELGKPSKPNRLELEWALVNGKPERTFIESYLDAAVPMDLPHTRSVRVELTREEVDRVYADMLAKAKACGFDFEKSFTTFQRAEDSWYEARRRGPQHVKATVSPSELVRQAALQTTFTPKTIGRMASVLTRALPEDQVPHAKAHVKAVLEGRQIAQALLGHDVPRVLPETGGHAWNPFEYVFGEHLKHVLLTKTYAAVHQALRQHPDFQAPGMLQALKRVKKVK